MLMFLLSPVVFSLNLFGVAHLLVVEGMLIISRTLILCINRCADGTTLGKYLDRMAKFRKKGLNAQSYHRACSSTASM